MKKVMTITVTAITILSVACQTKQEKPFSLVPSFDITKKNFWFKPGFRYIRSRGYPLDCSVQSPSPLGAAPGMPNSNLVDCRRA